MPEAVRLPVLREENEMKAPIRTVETPAGDVHTFDFERLEISHDYGYDRERETVGDKKEMWRRLRALRATVADSSFQGRD